jgi:ubiquinone/menaquinone biosynthesis C-methylase UbiE
MPESYNTAFMNMRNIYYRLSPEMRLLSRKLYYFPTDLLHKISGKKNKLEPDKGDIYIGSGDFTAQGKHQLGLLIRMADLKPGDSVLDVGSGIGRTAVALTGYLDKTGNYEGFDVVEKGVKWCNKNIKTQFPNFNFRFVPLNNDLYNTATNDAVNFKFPYTENRFDVVFLFSVFTHMRPAEVKNYLNEIYRVLKPGGRCLASFFVYNQTEEKHISENNSFRFPFKENGYRLMDKNVECANIAFEEQYLKSSIEKGGLLLTEILDGYWKDEKNKKEISDFQDVLILKKP